MINRFVSYDRFCNIVSWWMMDLLEFFKGMCSSWHNRLRYHRYFLGHSLEFRWRNFYIVNINRLNICIKTWLRTIGIQFWYRESVGQIIHVARHLIDLVLFRHVLGHYWSNFSKRTFCKFLHVAVGVELCLNIHPLDTAVIVPVSFLVKNADQLIVCRCVLESFECYRTESSFVHLYHFIVI